MPANFIEPKEITITDRNGKERTYILSLFNAIAGREIIAKYPLSSMPKIGDYKSNEEVMLKLMNFVAAIDASGNKVKLSTGALINNHVPDWETLAKIELQMIEYNCSFFLNGNLQNLLNELPAKFLSIATKILMDSLAQSSQAEKPPSTN